MTGDEAPPLMHLYPLNMPHGDASIKANSQGIAALRALLGEMESRRQGDAIARGRVELYTADGEGYDFHVELDASDWQSHSWQAATLPYSDELQTMPDPPAGGGGEGRSQTDRTRELEWYMSQRGSYLKCFECNHDWWAEGHFLLNDGDESWDEIVFHPYERQQCPECGCHDWGWVSEEWR